MFLTTLSQSLPIRWQEPWLLPAVLGLGAAVAAAVLLFYPPQLRPVRRPWKYVIPGLRLLAFCALAVSVARPVALRARPAEESGVLLVLLDRSRSMSIADGTRRPAELVALADAFGLLKGRRTAGNSTTGGSGTAADFEQLQALAAQAIRAQEDLNYARVSGRGVEAAETRVRKQVDELREKGKALVASVSSVPELRNRLKPISDLPQADARGAWTSETRRRLEQAAEVLKNFRDQADRRLYDNDPEVKRICSEVAKRTRFELAAETLVRPNGLLARLGPETQALVFSFADQAALIPDVHPAESSATQPATEIDNAAVGPAAPATPANSPLSSPIWTSSRITVRPDGGATDVLGALSATVAAAQGRPIRGVLVLTDGQHVGAPDPVSSAAAAAALPPGVPMIAVNVAGQNLPKDLSIVEVVEPGVAFVGETVTLRVRVRGTGGLPPDASLLRLADVEPGEPVESPIAPTALEKPASKRDEQGAWARFALKLDRPGVHELKLSIAEAPDEVSAQNNVVRRWIKVLPDRIRIALVGGSSGNDFKNLSESLGRRGWFDVQTIAVGKGSNKLAMTPAQILRQQVLILHDVPVGALSREQWQAVDKLVHQRGGSVIFVAGPTFDAAGYIAQPLASSLLPFNFQQEKKPTWRVEQDQGKGMKLAPGYEFARSDVLRLTDADTVIRKWQELPGLPRVLPVRSAKPGTRVMLRDAEQPTAAAIVTEMRPGAGGGRTFYVGSSETWRWAAKNGEEYDRFWRQLVRHAAEEPYAARQGRLVLDLDRVAVNAGQTVQIRAKILGDDELPDSQGQSERPTSADPESPAKPSPGETPPLESLHVELLDASGFKSLRVVKLAESADGSGRLRGTLGDLLPGKYLVRLGSTVSNAAGVRWPQLPLCVESGDEAEMRNLAGDPDRLKRMAEPTGGRLLRLDQFDAVPGLLAAAAADDRSRVVEWSLWDSPWLFALVVACLGAEWGLRKRAGLA